MAPPLGEPAQAAGKDVSAPECPFWDAIPFAYYAPAANWAQDAVKRAGALGLADPQSDFFRPNDPLTRQEGEVLAAGLTAS